MGTKWITQAGMLTAAVSVWSVRMGGTILKHVPLFSRYRFRLLQPRVKKQKQRYSDHRNAFKVL